MWTNSVQTTNTKHNMYLIKWLIICVHYLHTSIHGIQ